jgi:hypothetical protein
MVWTKHRDSGSINPTITDSVRGGDKQLVTATDAGESSGAHGKISSFDSDGITVIDGTNATYPRLTFNEVDPFGASVGGNYVGWSWKAGGTASSNTDGTITSTVSASTESRFSILTYTGNGTAGATIGHGLGSTPAIIIVKNRADDNWAVYHGSLGATKYLKLNATDASITSITTWNDTEPTSSVFSVNSDNRNNQNNDTYVAYCFAEKKGYSKFGSYTGNGNDNGPMIYTGFKPAWVMIKSSTAAEGWLIFDNRRPGYNYNHHLGANSGSAEATGNNWIDTLSNGFKCRKGQDATNKSSATYIYMAFAENPFVTSTGIPTTAR